MTSPSFSARSFRPTERRSGRRRVLVVGGGVAGIEALLGLHQHLAERTALTLLAPGADFSYRPLAIGQAFASSHPHHVPLARVARDTGTTLVSAAAEAVDLERHQVRTSTNRSLEYDALLVAVGARIGPELPHSTTWRPEGDPEVYGGFLRDVEEGYVRRVAFVVPPGAAWPLPVYELALMTARDAVMMGQDVEMSIVTPETEPLALFGRKATAAVREELRRAGIRLFTGTAAEVHHGHASTVRLLPTDEVLEVDRVIAVPHLIGPELPGLPSDDEGFIRVGPDQRIDGSTTAWAAGDGTTQPVKYGGLATHQARLALTGIAHLLGGQAPSEPTVPRLRGVLMFGGGARGLGAVTAEVTLAAPLWSPAAKIAGTYLPAYFRQLDATAAPTGGERQLAAVERTVVVDEPRQAEGAEIASLPLEGSTLAAGGS